MAGLIFVWLVATAWARPLAMPDEGRYVGIAWEMMRSGDWLTPSLDGLPFFHKPCEPAPSVCSCSHDAGPATAQRV